MAKIVWGADGQRTYAAGVDRGVLYIPGLPGVPWNGLKAVNEAPSGGEPRPYYLDGIKYAQISAAEEFSATIQAFSAPSEFAVCDGSKKLMPGLYATQQPRKSFGMSYRTMNGNDIAGINAGYDIHIVYNALAAATSRSNVTLGESVEPRDLSWDISTRPPSFYGGFKPTAHFVVNSKEAVSSTFSALERILYGSTTSAPMLPSLEEFLSLFDANSPLRITIDGVGGYTADGLSVLPLGDDAFIITNNSAVTEIADGVFSILY